MIKMKSVRWPVLLLVMAFLFGSCNDGDSYLPPNPAIVKKLNALYPNAQNIEWNQKGVYYVAECYSLGAELDVWFDANANWIQTETALFSDDLPGAVNTAFSQGDYASWVIDNVTQLNFPDNPELLYVLEVQQGDQERALFYSEFGGLLHVRDITDADDTLWPEILNP